jgi:predicted Zn-dependent protease
MKRWILLSLILVFAAGAIVLSQTQKADAPVSPAALFRWLAGVENEAARVPASATRLTETQEIQIGDHLAAIYSGFFAPYGPGDKAIAATVQQLGLRLSAYAHRKLPYRFYYNPNPDFINAFSLPGGSVFIGRGLIQLMDSEDELAFVLGHEIEHIDHYHCAERVQTFELLKRIPLGGLVAIPVEVFEAGYSKDQELEADREGTRLAVAAGYSPLGAMQILEKLDRLHKERLAPPKTIRQELSRAALETLSGYFASHPPTEERAAEIRKMIIEEGWETLPPKRTLPVKEVLKVRKAEVSSSLPPAK